MVDDGGGATVGASDVKDPRPYVGEPLALDLLNTRWMWTDGPHDLLDGVAGLTCWLASNALTGRCRATEKVRAATVETRDAILQALTGGGARRLNSVLNHGRLRRTLTETRPTDIVEVSQPEWLAGWLAADNLLRLLEDGPHRIKQCAHAQCVLWFYDTSKNGSRRWHSMTTCGNRTKAARHYAAKNPQAAP